MILKNGSDILICPSNDMDWKDTEEKLYEDVPMKDNSQQIIATDTAKNRAVKEVTGSYGMAAVEAVVIICGMFLLVYNVMQISMSGDIRQMALLHTIGTTRKQIRKIYIRQIMRTIVPGGIAGIGLSVCVIAISDTATIGQTVSEWIWRRRRTADLSGGNLVVSGSLHVVGNLGCIGTGDLADCKQNLYRGNALHGAEGKQETTAWKSRSCR